MCVASFKRILDAESTVLYQCCLFVCLPFLSVCLSVGVANRGAGQTRIKLIVNLVTMFRHDFSKGEDCV